MTDPKEPVTRPEWSPWHLDGDLAVLWIEAVRGYRYEIDLESCVNSAEVLDWLCQIVQKDWADDRVVAGLLHAVNDVLRPQAHLCSSGVSKRLSRSRIRRLAQQSP